ncbi:hypothetical protein CTI12_AA194660 [Artemisia annua]|uniref:Zinc knuckle CX2CX4HX4C n=1 Tax=Artemisia annua TaxID=35608 RepID=A0A2U1P404_ARTAN|nr:hypothetical protein CTI12_AA194660 [Artemisia annua]
MLDPDPTLLSMDPPPKPSDESVQPRKSNKSFVSNKSRNIEKNLKKNSSKGASRNKSAGEMDMVNEGLDTMEGVEEGNEEAAEVPPNSKEPSQMNVAGGNYEGENKTDNANVAPAMNVNAGTHTRSSLSFASALQGMTGSGSNKLRITSSMCENAFGRATFARVLVEVDAAKGLPGSIEVCYKSLGKSMSLEVEYAWSPLVCSHCKVFGHNFEACTKRELTEVEGAKMNEINAQHAQKASGGVKADDAWKTVSYKKV